MYESLHDKLHRQYEEERIRDYLFSRRCGDPTDQPGFPTEERVQQWLRAWDQYHLLIRRGYIANSSHENFARNYRAYCQAEDERLSNNKSSMSLKTNPEQIITSPHESNRIRYCAPGSVQPVCPME